MHIAADRFAGYMDELREFSSTYRVPYGKPEDLVLLLERLRNSQAFAADFGSMIRSINLREQFQASESALITLVAVAWGGVTASDPGNNLPSLIDELGKIIQEGLKPITSEPSKPPAKDEKEPAESTPVTNDTIRELEEISPDVQMYRKLLKFQGTQPELEDASHNSVSGRRGELTPGGAPTSSGERAGEPKRISRSEHFLFQKAAERHLIEEEEIGDKHPSLPVTHPTGGAGEMSPSRHLEPSAAEIHPSLPVAHPAGGAGEISRSRRLEPKATEIVVLTLTGLVVALLLNVAAMPVYRARVSVYMPSAVASGANGSVLSAPGGGSQEASLLNGALTGKVAERLLMLPHSNPILRQDAASRLLRDLDLGGAETILYANLVVETSHQVKVRRLQSENLYEITCDSWSPQFAATFCNELIKALEEQPSTPMPSRLRGTSVRAVDAADGPGIQIYPRWYLTSAAGLAVGCLIGILVGFVERTKPEPVQEDEATSK